MRQISSHPLASRALAVALALGLVLPGARAMQQVPEDVVELLGRSTRALDEGELVEAEAGFRRALIAAPRSA